MAKILLITVRFHDGRYYGTGDWPPSPARLFQALVAGIGQGGPLSDDACKPLEWLEQLSPPIIVAPHMLKGQAVTSFVPDNELDATGGDPGRIALIRVAKPWRPKLFDQRAAFHYAWQFEEDAGSLAHAERICEFAAQLYQLGRGIDQAWAIGEIVEPQWFDELLIAYVGIVHRPTAGRHGARFACPHARSLKSLTDRHEARSHQFKAKGQGRAVKLQFAQAPQPRFRPATYDSPPTRQVFELRSRTREADRIAWPLSRISALVLAVRDSAVAKLKGSLLDQQSQIEKCLVGRKADGKNAVAKDARVRIVPLPSIGDPHVDRAIRRILVEVPAGCLLRIDDVFWAFSGLELTGALSASVPDSVLTATSDSSMLRHYGVDSQEYRTWRTITPAALPEIAQRRRIEPTRRAAEAKRGAERANEQQHAAISVILALRHADVRAQVDSIRVQREPFYANGERVEAFAPGTRFPKEGLWHVELVFAEAVSGPVVIGDGRYYGLGLMAPEPHQR